MASFREKICRGCKEKYGDGEGEVQPGEFCFVPEMVEAGILQLCSVCTSMIPTEILTDARLNPKQFIYNEMMRRKYHKGAPRQNRLSFADDGQAISLAPAGELLARMGVAEGCVPFKIPQPLRD